jgi:type VI protein secretion system component VasF
MTREEILEQFAQRAFDAMRRGDAKKAALYRAASQRVREAKDDTEATDIAWETISSWERLWGNLFWKIVLFIIVLIAVLIWRFLR